MIIIKVGNKYLVNVDDVNNLKFSKYRNGAVKFKDLRYCAKVTNKLIKDNVMYQVIHID